MKKVSVAEKKERLKRNEDKWTATLMDAGWTVLPTIILERQQALGLDPLDLNILLQLAKYWWYADNPPRPSKKSIADAIGVDESTIRKRIQRMEKDGLIKRTARYHPNHKGQQPNEYSFDGLIKESLPFAEEFIEDRENRRQEDLARKTRKKPRMSVVKGGKE